MKAIAGTSAVHVRVLVAAGILGSAILLLAAAMAADPTSTAAAPLSPRPMPKIDSAQVPADMEIPDGFKGNPIAFFDDYSWRAFVALVWPALKDKRGEPDAAPGIVVGSGVPGVPRVFESYKALWEVFHTDGSAPAGWNQFEPKQYNPCNVDTSWGDLTLGSFSKFGDLGQAGVGTLVGPLVAQPAAHPSYVRFMTGFNKAEFDHIINPDPSKAPPKPLYIRNNLVAARPVVFPSGVVDVKSSWMDMTHAANPGRYYTRKAWVLDPANGNSSQITVGLVGLHIVQKTPTRPQWIWTTFEHVDNVPPAEPGAPGTFAFNDGTTKAMPKNPPYSVSPLPIPTPAPFNVTRVKLIHNSTAATNRDYRTALKGTIWENYQLVMTQWPLAPNSPTVAGDPIHTFPGFSPPGSPPPGNDATAFANTTMETFDQDTVRNGCMNCHNSTRIQSDFIWSLQDHAFQPILPSLLIKSQPFRDLRKLMQNREP